MNGRKDPESGIGPEFIRVVYDEKGNPVAVKPADASAMSEFVPDAPNTPNTPNTTNVPAVHARNVGVNITNGGSPYRASVGVSSIHSSVPYVVEQWLTIISKNILALKAQVEQTQANYNEVIAQIQNIKIPEVKIPEFPKMPEIEMPDMKPVYEGIDGANHRIDALTHTMTQRMEAVNQQVGEGKLMYKLLADQINTMNEIVSTIASEFAQQKVLTKDTYEVLTDKMRQLNEQLSDSFSKLKTVEMDIDALRADSMQRFSFLDEKVAAMHRQLSVGNEKTEGDLIVLNDVVSVMNDRIAELNEKINDMQQMREEVAQIVVQNKLDRQLMIEEIVARTTEKMKNFAKRRAAIAPKVAAKIGKVVVRVKVKKGKMKHRKIVKKIKVRKAARKITRTKINKNLIAKKLRKTDIGNYETALVVTERKTQRYGRAVFDVAKRINKNVVMIMQDKLNEADGFEPVTYDAIDNSEAVFIVTNRKMRKNFAVKNAALKRRVFLVDKNLKFSEVKY